MKENRTLQRYEFKYFLSKDFANEIINHANKFMILDKFADTGLEKKYLVRSIYFEDDFNSNFEEKINGYRIRKKFRLRFYNEDLDKGPIFLETKGRNLERTYKIRAKLNRSDLDIIKQGKSLSNLLLKYPKSIPVKDFVLKVVKKT